MTVRTDGGWGTRRLLPVALALVLLIPVSATAEEPQSAPAAATALDPGATNDGKTKRKKSAPVPLEDGPQIELSGRVFALAESDQRTEYTRDLSIPTARLQLDARFGIAQAVLEADIASKSLVKDAYLRLVPTELVRVYAGQFKAPFLARNLESRWDLPLISRGLVNDYLTDDHQLGGRRLGAMLELKNKEWLGAELQLGAFQGGKDELGQRQGEDLSGRFELSPWRKHLDVGVSGYWSDAANGLQKFAGGADVMLRVSGLRLSAEALMGKLPLGDFTAQLGLATFTFALDEQGVWALEPVVGAEALQLRGPTSGTGKAAVAGLNFHYAERVKLMLHAERGLFPGDDGLKNKFAVQLAGRF